MNILGHNFALQGYAGLGTTWANKMNFGMNNALVAGSITRPVDMQFCVLSLLLVLPPDFDEYNEIC